MKAWIDVMRRIEPLMDDYERAFDALSDGGVDGLVIGPLRFGGQCRTFDPDPTVYQAMDCPVPPAPPDALPARRRRLEEMLSAARDRGWSVLLFEPGCDSWSPGAHWCEPASWRFNVARILDTMQHYPMASGCVCDGPEWGYEISPHLMAYRSFIFNDLPPAIAARCAELGYDYHEMVETKDRLFKRLHELPRRIDGEIHNDGSPFGCAELFGDDAGLKSWMRFRVESVTACVAGRREMIDARRRHAFQFGVGLRTPAFAELTGSRVDRLARHADRLFPKHYFWHRGFDGMYGTVFRFVETLTQWNPGMDDGTALKVVEGIFGLRLPGIRDRDDFEKGFPQEFFHSIVQTETRRALSAVDDPERIIPWVDAGRRPHHGDPFGPPELFRTLQASERAGLKRFLYHHYGNLSPGEWQVISGMCGKPWRPAYHDQPCRETYCADNELRIHGTSYSGWHPLDRDEL